MKPCPHVDRQRLSLQHGQLWIQCSSDLYVIQPLDGRAAPLHHRFLSGQGDAKGTTLKTLTALFVEFVTIMPYKIAVI